MWPQKKVSGVLEKQLDCDILIEILYEIKFKFFMFKNEVWEEEEQI